MALCYNFTLFLVYSYVLVSVVPHFVLIVLQSRRIIDLEWYEVFIPQLLLDLGLYVIITFAMIKKLVNPDDSKCCSAKLVCKRSVKYLIAYVTVTFKTVLDVVLAHYLATGSRDNGLAITGCFFACIILFEVWCIFTFNAILNMKKANFGKKLKSALSRLL